MTLEYGIREDYEIQDGGVLGRGRFSRVMLAHCRRHRCLLAVKIIPISGVDDDETIISRTAREFGILSKLIHENVIAAYDHFLQETAVWITMEYAQRGDLRKFVHVRRRLPGSLARTFFAQILEGLTYIHSQGIAHRDIKCENILITGDECRVKICDLGCAVYVDDDRRHEQQAYGSPAYAAPEVVDRVLQHELKPTDVWSAGVVLFFMVSGYLPFGCDDIQRIRQRMNYPLRWPRPLKLTEKSCREYVKYLLQLRPQDRPTAEDAMHGGHWMTSNSVTSVDTITGSKQSKQHFDMK